MRYDMNESGRGGHGRHRGRGHSGFKMVARFGGGQFGGGFADDFGDDPGGRGPGGRGPDGRGRRGRMFAAGELRLMILHLLTAGERHGYDLIKAIGDLAGGHYAPSPGVVYPTLSLLLDEGLIAESPGVSARKGFVLTEAGQAEVERSAEVVRTILARLAALAEQRGGSASPQVMRAMTNLKMALRQRASAGLETATAHQIADILDEAARRIERL